MIATWKQALFRLLGQDADPVVVHFASGSAERALEMYREVSSLVPEREHYIVSLEPLHCPNNLLAGEWRTALRRKRIGLAPFLLGEPHPLHAVAVRAAPVRLLAFNARGERHHLHWRSPIASLLFLRGVPLDRIWLRPRWWPFARERSKLSERSITLEGCQEQDAKPRIAIVSPYFPWPLGHGGAVRIYHLLREAARDFNVYLYAFAEPGAETDTAPVLALVRQAVLLEMPRFREPRWASIDPPEVREFHSPALKERLRSDTERLKFAFTQVEYTHLARYGGDALVEHDVTFDLYAQVHRRQRTVTSWWDWKRWLWFERRAAKRARIVIAMAKKDAALLAPANVRVLPNGVDLERFVPAPEPDAQEVLFIGSFRHFPNVAAFEFLTREIWPMVLKACPHAHLNVVAGANHQIYARAEPQPSVTLHGFIADVVPFYRSANIVVSPTLVSAGTNLKVLEAMAMERPIVSTSSGCAGLELVDGKSVLLAETAAASANAIATLLRDSAMRQRLAANARRIADEHFDWRAIGQRQREIWKELL